MIIEDNADLCFGLLNNLEIEGYSVETAADGRSGLQAFEASQPDLVILDLMLPELDGFRVLRSLRQQGHTIPVLILTARGSEEDKVRGLRLGADDYVTKPFGLLELLARVEALLRRALGKGVQPQPARKPERFGMIEVDARARTVRRNSEDVILTPKEFDLLLALLRARGGAVSRLSLLQQVWGYSSAVVTRTVDTHIAELRRKIEQDPAAPQYILTVRKMGYRIKL
ncbi:MAG TPA: response regulator transcription factor [Bryobacteraceae bacterium]|nr:response regulator transcription factor [Bryobacteraceae bacterium]